MNDAKKLLALHKPKGYVVTHSDERGRKTVYINLLSNWAFNNGGSREWEVAFSFGDEKRMLLDN